jgi:hypothetical protein
MTAQRLALPLIALFWTGGFAPSGQDCALSSSRETAFLGTWVIAMTNPAGATETVRISDQNGNLAASVQSERFPPIKVTGLLKDGDMLVLTLTRFENGRPIRAVISLTLDGDTMHLAQMLEFSETIKRGPGKKQA